MGVVNLDYTTNEVTTDAGFLVQLEGDLFHETEQNVKTACNCKHSNT